MGLDAAEDFFIMSLITVSAQYENLSLAYANLKSPEEQSKTNIIRKNGRDFIRYCFMLSFLLNYVPSCSLQGCE